MSHVLVNSMLLCLFIFNKNKKFKKSNIKMSFSRDAKMPQQRGRCWFNKKKNSTESYDIQSGKAEMTKESQFLKISPQHDFVRWVVSKNVAFTIISRWWWSNIVNRALKLNREFTSSTSYTRRRCCEWYRKSEIDLKFNSELFSWRIHLPRVHRSV